MNTIFQTENNLQLPIVPGFREQVKPTWKSVFKSFEYSPISFEKANNLKTDLRSAISILNKYGISIEDKRILDVGCYLGIQAIAGVEHGASSAVGIDIPEYYVNQSTDGNVDASKVLTERRQQLLNLHTNLDQSKISFEDKSVFEMSYDSEFDLIFSWETFEHITNPEEALKRIYKALKPGGVSYNLYNPFFSISGGHSMCTLDFPFAHALLTDRDFQKYVEIHQPEGVPENYSQLCCNFFTKNLNRMTQRDLKTYIKKAGFKTLDFIGIPDLNLLKLVDTNTLEGIQTLYPTATLKDLLCGYVYFIIQKPC